MKYRFDSQGVERFNNIYDPKDCSRLIKSIYSNRDFNKLFMTKKAFEKERDAAKNVKIRKNPRPGHNLLDKLDCSFIFETQKAVSTFKKILGNYYRILDHKLVMGVPQDKIPKWVKDYTKGFHTVNLADYIKPIYRDITYFRGIDYHQDIIDWPERNADFITGYVYLEDVLPNMSPLYVLPLSHFHGATLYPHKLDKVGNKIRYKDKANNEMLCNEQMLIGKSGTLFCWHPFILHGTKPHGNDYPRISVRLLIEKNRIKYSGCKLDYVNDKIKGDKSLDITKNEQNKSGKFVKKNNFINKLNH